MNWPCFMRRPLNVISMPTVVEQLPIYNPGFAFGDPREKAPSLARYFEGELLPFNSKSQSLIAPFPAPGEATRDHLERLAELPASMPVALFESKTPLWPNYLVHNAEVTGGHLQAVRSCMRHQGRGFTEAWCVLPAKKMRQLLQAKPVRNLPFLAPEGQNRRFLSTALDYHRTLNLLHESQKLKPVSRLTVIMPHFDDEVLQCGGALLQAIAENATVQVIWLSDGCMGVSGVGREQSSEIRKQEARLAMDELGVKNLHFLNGVETQLGVDDEICSELRRLLSEFSPQRVHCVWWADNNVDHYEANLIMRAAWPPELKATIAASSLWQVMPKQTLLELDEHQQQQKAKALAHYKSQIAEVDYQHLSQHLDAYFASDLEASAAENFWHVSADEYFAALSASKITRRRWYS